MRQTVITSGTAHWNTRQRHTVRITDDSGGLLDWFPIAIARERPSLETLWHTSWLARPDSQWQEASPGSWTRPVSRHVLSGDSQAGP